MEIVEAKKMKISTTLTPQLQADLLEVFMHNLDAIVWNLNDMMGIDLIFLCHRLALNSSSKPTNSEMNSILL